MANFLLIVDPDRLRRASMMTAAARDIRFLPHLVGGNFENDFFSMVWAASPTAPVSQHSDRGNHCQLFGEPLDESGKPCDAAAIAARYATDFTRPGQLDGFYAAVFHDPGRGLRVEADVLGQFPIYYWHRDDVLLVGSSLALFRTHPLFSPEVNPRAIAALLLTSGQIGGETLEKSVRRLKPDHVLTFTGGRQVRELAPPPMQPLVNPAGIDEAVDEVEAVHERFLRGSLANSRRPGMLLSGGLDSRLLAGLVTRLGHEPHCLTFGSPSDMDAHCATRVAETLGLKQTVDNIQPDAYPAYAENSVRWEQLSGGLYAIPMGWNLASKAPDRGIDRIVTGLTLDAVVGGPKQVAESGKSLSFEKLRVSTLGFSPDELVQLVRDPTLGTACDEVRQAVVEEYLKSGSEDYLRTWRINLASRNRFPVGACAWRYSFHAWPVQPALDRRLLRLGANLPQPIVAQRRVQKSMLVRHFPRLAALELDRNYFDTEPLQRTRGSMIYSWRRRLFKARCHAKALLGADPRFYVRVMGFNSPGWKQVRSLNERCRSSLGGYFNLEALERILPGPKTRVRRKSDTIIHSTPLKNMVGLMHWFHQRA